MSWSRYSRSLSFIDETGEFYGKPGLTLLGWRDSFSFRHDPETIAHVVRAGETLMDIAHKYYGKELTLGSSLWWAIAEYQPIPILDPTSPLPPGEVIYVPPLSMIQEYVNKFRPPEF